MPKKILSVFLCVLVVFSCVPMSVISVSAEGASDLTVTIDTGAEVTLTDTDSDSYYDIGTTDELYAFAYAVNGAGNTSINAELTADIVVNEGKMTVETDSTAVRHWTPIGNYDNQYTGTFNGNDHTVSGMYLYNSEVSYVGLFGCIDENGAVYNTGVINSYFYGNEYVGGVVGDNYGTITNCYNTGEVEGNDYVGGVVGENDYGATITNCYNTGDVHGDNCVGGVVGENDGTITNCYNTGAVCGTYDVGSVVGYNDGTITNCYNIGKVIGALRVGGMVGYNYGTITNCYNTGDVSGDYVSDDCYVGGVVGYNDNGTTTNCYYLNTAYNGGINGADVRGSAKAKTADQFANGEVAYLLQGEQTENIWGQKISTDELPTFGGDKVYCVYQSCSNEDGIYTNNADDATERPAHNFENGFCTVCDAYEPATLNADGYYEIGNAGQLYWFADKVNNDYANFGSDNAILTADIIVNDGEMTSETDSTKVRHWTPISNNREKYKGTFNGNNHTVSGLYVNNTETNYVGLFGCIGENGAVENTGVINSYFNGNDYVGSVAGYNSRGAITNCYNTGEVSGSEWYVGGLAGNNSIGAITNCYNTGTVSGTSYVGGVAGSNSNGTITNCYYLNTAYNGGVNGEDVEGSAEAKTVEQLKSGEVAYLLQGEQTENVWGQKLGTENYPVFSENKVYFGYLTCADNHTGIYTNNSHEVVAEKPNHDWKDSTCLVCSKVCVHTWENGVCSVCTKACKHDWDSYGACTICSSKCAHKELRAEFEWDEPYQGECYVYMELYCTECDCYVDSDSTYVKAKGTVEAEDCLHEDLKTYEASFEYEGVTYTDTKEFGVKSENHTAMNADGFCSDCGRYQPAKYNEEADVYEISNAGQLYWYAQQLNEQNLEIHAKLTKDIVIPENAPEWVPINCSYAYFDGNFKTISGLKSIGGEYDTYVGLFGNEGWWYEISNLHITNSYFEGKDCVGAVVACMSNGGNVTNCYVTNTTVKGDSGNVGTLVGYLTNSHIINCYVDTDTLVGYHNDSYGSIENSYYLADEETDSYDGTTAKTAKAFASGEVAYLLQAGVAEEDNYDDDGNYIGTIVPEVWGQKIGTDTYPVFKGNKVYTVENCIGEAVGYSNTEGENVGHVTFENGFCTVCDAYEPATLNADGYYEIGNAGQLYWFADKVNNDNENENFGSANAILTADIVVNEGIMTAEIDSTAVRYWTPIGHFDTENNESYGYSGAFDGNNKTVSGLYFNNSESKDVGLFGCVSKNGEVKDTGVINSYFYGNNRVGGVVGYNDDGTITNCYNTSTVSGNSLIGGVVGTTGGTITNCYNTGTVSGKEYYIGGVAGRNDGTVTSCYNTGTISDEGSFIGGVVGASPYNIGITTNCYYLNTTCTGGIAGRDVAGSVEAKTADQFASGEVAYLLQGEQTEDIWGQKLGTDELPALGGEKVYYGYITCDETDNTIGYTNIVTSEETKPDHNFKNGFCTACDAYEPATLNADGYYEIGNAGQLYWFADKVNNDNENFGSVNAILTADIVVNEGKMTAETDSTAVRHWTPIGNYDNQYTGTFNGNNHTVSGLYFNNTHTDHVGLFGLLGENGAVENTGVINSYFNGNNYVGGVLGRNNVGTTTNCYNTGEVSGNDTVGGVVGANSGTITNCYNTGEVNGDDDVGGVVGYNYGTITNCYNTGEVSGSEWYVGGVVGNNSGTITNCYNTGDVRGSVDVGGVVGYNYHGGTLTNCYNIGKVSGNEYVGGVVGVNYLGTTTNCYNTGEVSGSSDVGGVVAYNGGTITNSYYLDTACTGGINGADVKGSAEAKTADQFASGEVAYLLQAGVTADENGDIPEIWGQKLGTESYPLFGSDKVYAVINCKGEAVSYNNTKGEILDHNFENGFCTVCDAMDGIAQVKGYSISLGGNIAVNYYMALSDEVLADENAEMVFTLPNGASTYEVRIPVKDVTPDENGYYMFTCEVAAKEMTSVISAKIVTSNAESDMFEYSVKQYAEYILAKAEEANAGGIVGGAGGSNTGAITAENEYTKAAPLVKAMLNYGANAQLYFDHNTDNLANDSMYMSEADKALVEALDLSEYAYSIEGEQEGVSFYGAILSLKSETAIKLYFDFENEADVETLAITVDGKAVKPEKNGKHYEIKISDIPANSLGEMHEIKVGNLTLNYGAFSYGNVAMGTSKENLKNTIKAMYAYNQAAIEYLS